MVNISFWLMLMLLICRENAEALLVASTEIALEVNGRSYSMKIDSSSFERVEKFKYLGTNLTDQNSIKEEIKKKLKSGNACYNLVQNLLSSGLLSKN